MGLGQLPSGVGRNGRVVASSGGALLNVSDDGVTWRTFDTGMARGLTSLSYGAGVFVGAGDGVPRDEQKLWHRNLWHRQGSQTVRAANSEPAAQALGTTA